MRVLSMYLRKWLSSFVSGASAAAATVAVGDGNLPVATVLMLAAVLLISPSLQLGGQIIGRAITKA